MTAPLFALRVTGIKGIALIAVIPMMYRYDPPILSYAKYRFTCDYCDWQTDSYELLSQAARELATHNGVHDPIKPDTPAPIKPSQVLALIRNK